MILRIKLKNSRLVKLEKDTITLSVGKQEDIPAVELSTAYTETSVTADTSNVWIDLHGRIL